MYVHALTYVLLQCETLSTPTPKQKIYNNNSNKNKNSNNFIAYSSTISKKRSKEKNKNSQFVGVLGSTTNLQNENQLTNFNRNSRFNCCSPLSRCQKRRFFV
ncbi:unnamed protein product [Ceratitis capitata]|uniref:(Mediterranean fruit fly) hypothetical protein n=1 Tax=Ceratitis capitata TaxID=7213 RepID=A0A811V980_CERCA|nr:unnamed protein product [Ceratitis capitata]